MSVASFSYIKISNPSSPSQPPSCSSSSSTYSTHHHHHHHHHHHQSYNRFTPTKPSVVTVRCSQADGPLRRPVATPPLRPPTAPTPPSASSPPPPQVAPPKPAPTSSVTAVGDKNVITMEFQRLKAKELQEYFKQKKIEDSNLGPFFGFLAKNEISNGRWAMFGFAVGMLTEYATGSDFVDQVKILLSNFGIVDLD